MDLWNTYKDDMYDDILHRMRTTTSNPDLQLSDEIYNETLILIEDKCSIISNKTLSQLGLTEPNRPMHDAFNQEIYESRKTV